MKKETETTNITPENAEVEIYKFLKDTKVGSVEFIAFCDALEWRESLNEISEKRRLIEILKSGKNIPELYIWYRHTSLSTFESDLRIEEQKLALIEVESIRSESIIPGYAKASSYSDVLIQAFEEEKIKYSNINIDDPILERSRRISVAHDYLADYPIAPIKNNDEITESVG